MASKRSNRPRTTSAPGRARRSRAEEILQASLIEYFRIAVAQAPGAPLLIAIPNGEARDAVTAAKLSGISAKQRAQLTDEEALAPYGLGVVPGAYDLLLILPAAKVVFLEVKRPEDKARGQTAGELSRMQILFGGRLGELGHNHRVIQSVDEFAELLQAHGVKLRVRWWGPEVGRPGSPPRLPDAMH